MRDLYQDLRFSLRVLAKQPSFLLAVVFTMALGLGANSVIFSAVNAVLLRPLPYHQPDRLIAIWQTRPDGKKNFVSGRAFLAFREQSRSFQQMAAIGGGLFNILGDGDAEQVFGGQLSWETFPLLGTAPALGRTFTPAEDVPGGPLVVVISHKLWVGRYAASPSVIGRTMLLNGKPHEIIGVMPEHFWILSKQFSLWVPAAIGAAALNRHSYEIIGRLNPSVSPPEAAAEMRAIAVRLQQDHPDLFTGWGVVQAGLREDLAGNATPVLWSLFAAVLMLLLIAVVNVANLLLARSLARRKEIAIRCSVGASPSRLLRQLLSESLLLGLLGGAAGLALARALSGVLLVSTPDGIPRLSEAALDFPVMAFTLLLSIGGGVLCGLLPAIQLLRLDLHTVLKSEGRSAAGSHSGNRSQRWLAVSQVALSIMLLCGAGLFLRSLWDLQTIDRGFRTDHLLILRLTLRSSSSQTAAQLFEPYREILHHIRSLPGVTGVAATSNLPLDGFHILGMEFTIPGRQDTTGRIRPTAAVNLVNPGYFQALAQPILQGREFLPSDRSGAAEVAIVSRSLARRYFPDGGAIGKTLRVGAPKPGQAEAPERLIVGVAGDILYPTRAATDSIEIYLPFFQIPNPYLHIMVRASTNPASLAPAVSRAIQRVAPQFPISGMKTMEDYLADLNEKPRWNSMLILLFGVIALLLAMAGVYGVISCSATQQTIELGVRLALGAQPAHLVRRVLAQGLKLALFGSLLGLAGYALLSGYLKTLVYGRSVLDPVAMVAATLLVCLAAMAASYVPARKASRVDPVTALRAGA
jgi:putative ABC transport system permease protein